MIVGAGYSGLSAALALHDEDVDAVVLEGSERVGGRVWSERFDGPNAGLVVDHGGQWVGPTQARLLAAAERFGCATFPTYNTGDHLELWTDGVCRPFRGAGPVGAPGVDEYVVAAEAIDEMAATIDLENPTATAYLEEWDSETVQSFLERTVADVRMRAGGLPLPSKVFGRWSRGTSRCFICCSTWLRRAASTS